jgi:hypothetical protein
MAFRADRLSKGTGFLFHGRCVKVEDAAELAAFLKGLQPEGRA